MPTLIMAAMLSVSFMSCSDDDDATGNANTLASILQQHKWVTTNSDYSEGSGDHAWVDMETVSLYFTSGSAGMEYWVIRDYDTHLGNSRRTEYNLFTYNVSGNTVTITDESGNTSSYNYAADCLVSASGTTLFKATAMTADDHEIISSNGPKGGKSGGSLSYSYNDRTYELTISGSGRMDDYSKSNQPWHDYYITKVTVEEGCTYIGKNAFNGLQLISEVSLPTSVTEIGDYAFSDALITSLSLPSRIVRIGEQAFADCKYLKSVNFYGCDDLQHIGKFAFASCPLNMGNFTMPKSMKTIDTFAFGTSTFSGLTLNEGLESIGQGAMGKLNAAKLVIPNSVKTIEQQAFRGTFSEIRIGTGLTSLGGAAFITSKSGKMYVSQGNPAALTSTINPYIIANASTGDAATAWTLYVPKGAKAAYQKAAGWKAFSSIVEDASLEGSISDTQTDNDGNKGGSSKNSSKAGSLTYIIDGNTYRTIKVEASGIPTFYMMQTELPPSSDFYIDGMNIIPLDANGDGYVIKTELRAFLIRIREKTGVNFRLPTKEEWLCAAKGGNSSLGYAYSGGNTADDVAWHKGNSGNKAHPVATKRPNELGFYDMSGNYAEIVSPTNLDCNIDGDQYGGSWKSEASACRVNSWEQGITSGRFPGSDLHEKNAVDGRYVTVRLVYSVE